jgi:hypothetical protein
MMEDRFIDPENVTLTSIRPNGAMHIGIMILFNVRQWWPGGDWQEHDVLAIL